MAAFGPPSLPWGPKTTRTSMPGTATDIAPPGITVSHSRGLAASAARPGDFKTFRPSAPAPGGSDGESGYDG